MCVCMCVRGCVCVSSKDYVVFGSSQDSAIPHYVHYSYHRHVIEDLNHVCALH